MKLRVRWPAVVECVIAVGLGVIAMCNALAPPRDERVSPVEVIEVERAGSLVRFQVRVLDTGVTVVPSCECIILSWSPGRVVANGVLECAELPEYVTPGLIVSYEGERTVFIEIACGHSTR